MIKLKKKLKLSTENKDLDIFPNYFFGIVLTSRLKDIFGIEYPPMFCEYWGNSNRWGNDIEAANRIARFLTAKIRNNPAFSRKIVKKYYQSEKKLKNICEIIEAVDLREKSNKELAAIFKQFVRYYFDVLAFGWLPVASEGFSSEFSGLLKKYLSDQMDSDEERINSRFIQLTTPRKSSLRQKAEKEIGVFINSEKKSKGSLEKFVENYLRKYQWINFDFHGPVLRKKDVLKLIDELKNRKNENRIRRLDMQFVKNNPLHSRLFETAREFMYIKNKKQEILFYSHFCLTKLFSEIAKRLKLSLKEVRNMIDEEIVQAMEGNDFPRREIARRSKHAVFVFMKDRMEIVAGEKMISEFLDNNLVEEKIQETKELKGQTACAGKGKGLAKIIDSIKEMGKMKGGDILVSSKTNPSFLAAIRKASAIVTDYGGITCHAAIVSRELGIPCVIGTKIATKVLKDGDLVEVDADKGIVKILKRK